MSILYRIPKLSNINISVVVLQQTNGKCTQIRKAVRSISTLFSCFNSVSHRGAGRTERCSWSGRTERCNQQEQGDKQQEKVHSEKLYSLEQHAGTVSCPARWDRNLRWRYSTVLAWAFPEQQLIYRYIPPSYYHKWFPSIPLFNILASTTVSFKNVACRYTRRGGWRCQRFSPMENIDG